MTVFSDLQLGQLTSSGDLEFGGAIPYSSSFLFPDSDIHSVVHTILLDHWVVEQLCHDNRYLSVDPSLHKKKFHPHKHMLAPNNHKVFQYHLCYRNRYDSSK